MGKRDIGLMWGMILREAVRSIVSDDLFPKRVK